MCMAPFMTKNSDMPVPCGKCPECRSRRVSEWSFRLMQEDKVSVTSLFLTLTYDTEHVPFDEVGRMNLCKRDVQLFFKRLRKAHGPAVTIKYYLAAEYGTKSWRPHYHIIIFNVLKELVQAAWPCGSVHFGTVSGASVGYTLKYISKPKRVPQYKGDVRVPEFSLMSKGLGKSYLTPASIRWHKSDVANRMYLNIIGGKKASMPRYFKDRMYTPAEREVIAAAAVVKFSDAKLKEYLASDEKTFINNKLAITAAYERMEKADTKNKI